VIDGNEDDLEDKKVDEEKAGALLPKLALELFSLPPLE